MENTYEVLERHTRKVTTNALKNSHHINMPNSIYKMVCDDFSGSDKGTNINFCIVRNRLTGNHLIVLCGIDDLKNIISNLNKSEGELIQ